MKAHTEPEDQESFEPGSLAVLRFGPALPSLEVEVEVVEIRLPDPGDDEIYYLIEPVAGSGRAWVSAARLEPHR